MSELVQVKVQGKEQQLMCFRRKEVCVCVCLSLSVCVCGCGCVSVCGWVWLAIGYYLYFTVPYRLSVVYPSFAQSNAVPTKPVGSVKASWNHDASVLLSWQPLSLTEAKGFPLYIVSYKSIDGSSRGSVNTTSSNVVINSLNSKISYIFSIQITTEKGNNKGDAEYSKHQV